MHNRIIGHRQIPARELIPHALNPRHHSSAQRQALRDLVGEVGFARSTLAYVADADKTKAIQEEKHAAAFEDREMNLERAFANAPLTLIDGHLRCDELGDEIVTVEVLDVNDEEARKLLLSIDPLASMAGYNEEALAELQKTVQTSSDALANLWSSVSDAQKAAERAVEEAAAARRQSGHTGGRKVEQRDVEAFLVIIECTDEKHQREVLKSCKKAGHPCKAVMS